MNSIAKGMFKQELYAYQNKVTNTLLKHDKIIINKSRQLGISHLFAIYGLLEASKGKTVLIVSPSLRQSKHLMDYIRRTKLFMETKGLLFPLVEETKTSYIFEGEGEIHSLPNSANAIRGFKADVIIFDEFAHFLHGTDSECIEAITPSLSRGGKIILISTPFGELGEYYQYWKEAKTRGFKRLTINYEECPDLKIEPIKAMMDLDSFKQEYCNTFLGEADSFFPLKLIKECIDENLEYEEVPTGPLYGGVDIGRKKDWTTMILVRKPRNTDYFEIKKKAIHTNTPYAEQEAYFGIQLSNLPIINLNMDETGVGNMLVENLKSKHHQVKPITFTLETKEAMIINLKKLMEDKKIKIPNDPLLINSIHAIKRKETETIHLKFEVDSTIKDIGHADLFWALALAVYNVDKRGQVIHARGIKGLW